MIKKSTRPVPLASELSENTASLAVLQPQMLHPNQKISRLSNLVKYKSLSTNKSYDIHVM